jgi:hypothetical protein
LEAWRELFGEIKATTAYDTAKHFDIYIKRIEYYTKSEEIWARIASQWLLYWAGDDAAYNDLLSREIPQWNAHEFELLQPFIWTVFRDAGFDLSSDSATKI